MQHLTFEQAKARQAELIAVCTETSRAWKAVPGAGTGPMGLTPDAVKFGPEYRAARRAYETCRCGVARFRFAIRETVQSRATGRKASTFRLGRGATRLGGLFA
jgi:hypothetical protein